MCLTWVLFEGIKHLNLILTRKKTWVLHKLLPLLLPERYRCVTPGFKGPQPLNMQRKTQLRLWIQHFPGGVWTTRHFKLFMGCLWGVRPASVVSVCEAELKRGWHNCFLCCETHFHRLQNVSLPLPVSYQTIQKAVTNHTIQNVIFFVWDRSFHSLSSDCGIGDSTLKLFNFNRK